jgi:glycosyltransferase involved in cell wall biosynthesis
MTQTKPYPVISIITCTYNSEIFLPKTLASVQTQTYKNIEHIINDSYSADGTLEIIHEYIEQNKNEYPIKLIQSPPGGVAKALNVASKQATGDILHYLHSDVYYTKNTSLECAATYFMENPDLVWLTGKLLVEFKGKKIFLPNTLPLKVHAEKALTITNFVSHENTFLRREALASSGLFNEDRRYPVEYGLWLNLVRDDKPLVVNEAFTVFIIHSGSTSTGSVFKFSKALLRGVNTLRKEKIIPIVGYYEDHPIYHQYRRLAKRVRGVF